MRIHSSATLRATYVRPRRLELVLATVVVLSVLAPTSAPAHSHADDTEGGGIEACPPIAFLGHKPTWMSQMPPDRETTITKQDVQITSDDGTVLAARVYLPGHRRRAGLPTVLTISPYNAYLGFYVQEQEDLGGGGNFAALPGYCDLAFFLRRGYAVVLADARGTHNSGGCFDYGGAGDRADGRAIVNWIAKQKWSNKHVGMYGISAYAMSQYAAATAAPRALKAIIPVAPITSTYRYYFQGGLLYDWALVGPVTWEQASAFPPPLDATEGSYAQRAATTVCTDNVAGYGVDPTMTEYWRERDQTRLVDKIKAAVFHVQGTLDENVTTDHFSTMWNELEDAHVRRKALLGPWQHEYPPPISNFPYLGLRWYEHWLRGNDTGFTEEPRVTAIDQRGETHTSQSWPLSRREVTFKAAARRLVPNGRGGTAAFKTPPQTSRSDTWSDPDMHVAYRSAPLSRDMRISGSAIVDLVASIDGTDADFAVHLFSVSSGGDREWVTHGHLDAVHRDGVNESKPVPPNKRVHYRIELLPREYVFAQGQRVEMLITGADSCLQEDVGLIDGSWDCAGLLSDPNLVTVTVIEGAQGTRLRIPTMSRHGS